MIAAVPAGNEVLGALPADGADPGKDALERVRRDGVDGGLAVQTVVPVIAGGRHTVVDRIEGDGVKAAVPALGAGDRRAALRAGPDTVEPGLDSVKFVDLCGQVARAAAGPDIEVGGGGSGGGAAVIEGGEHAPAVHVGLDVFDLQVAGVFTLKLTADLADIVHGIGLAVGSDKGPGDLVINIGVGDKLRRLALVVLFVGGILGDVDAAGALGGREGDAALGVVRVAHTVKGGIAVHKALEHAGLVGGEPVKGGAEVGEALEAACAESQEFIHGDLFALAVAAVNLEIAVALAPGGAAAEHDAGLHAAVFKGDSAHAGGDDVTADRNGDRVPAGRHDLCGLRRGVFRNVLKQIAVGIDALHVST